MPRILALLLALTLIACSGDDDSPNATPTPPSETTPGPGAFATAAAQPVSLPVQRVPVRWVPEASPFDIVSAGDVDAPFSARAAELRRQDPTAGPDEWQIGLVQGNAAPRIIHRTRKGLTSLSWTSGLRAGLLTERPVPSGLLGMSKAFRWQGSVDIDVASAEATEKLNPFPDAIGTIVEGSPFAVSLQPGAAGQSMVISFTRPSGPLGPPPAPMPGPPAPVSTHLIDAQGNSRRLEGLPDAASLAPLANGRALIGGPDRAGRVFLVPVQDGDALVVTMVSGMAVENIPGSSTNRRVFLALNAGATGTYAIYDSTTHSLRDIGRGPWPGQGAQGNWLEPNKIRAGLEYIDVNTGRREPMPTPTPDTTGRPGQSASPDNRYVIHTTHPGTAPSARECDGLPLKVEVEQAGTRRSVYECAGGNPATVTWLDNSHALVRSTRCRGGCDDPAGGLLLVDAVTRSAVVLTQGWVDGPYALPSPDKTRLLVGGDSLAVYTLAGTQQRIIEPPAGFRITTAVWSLDGASFAYLVSPRGWYFFGP